MGIFRRGSKDTSAELEPNGTSSDGHDAHGVQDTHDGHGAAAANGVTPTAPASRPSRRGGPFDRSEVPGLEGRLDLGALWLTGAPGMELRLEVEEESQNVVGVTAVLGESAVQLQAFAAPRSEGIWDDIRAEIAASITAQGGTADKTSGPLGNELRAQMPSQDPSGRTVFSPVRFIGVDGPRWFLRGVLSGPAAQDDDAASTLLEVVRATVVVRGDEAMAPRELLALQLPEQPGPETEVAVQDDAATQGAPAIDDFKPFERGPEITEIR